MRRKILLALLAAIALPGATSAHDDMHAWPAMTMGGHQYAIRVEDDGKISKCDALDTSLAIAVAEADCAKLKARGVPAEVVPAKPRTNPAGWVSFEDYPQGALRREESGAALIAMVVGTDGRLAECRVQASAGNADIDAAICTALTRRARFSPATYKGKPVLAVRAATFRMFIP